MVTPEPCWVAITTRPTSSLAKTVLPSLTKKIIKDRTGKVTWKFRGKPARKMYDEEQYVLAEAVRTGKQKSDGDYLCKSSMWTIMGCMSCYTGKKYTWDEALASNWSMTPESLFATGHPSGRAG